jgi:hypothetical protein
MNRKHEVKTGIGSSKMLLNEHRKVLLWLQSGDIIHMPSIEAVMTVSKDSRLCNI